MGWIAVKWVRGSGGRVDSGWIVVKWVRGSGGRVDSGVDCSQMGEGFRWEGRQ